MSIPNSSSCSSLNENFTFECNQHAANIYEKLQKLYEDKDLFDTDLIAGNGNDCIKIPAHKIVLSALSEYFWEIFHGTGKTSKTNEVEVKTIEASTLKSIIDYMYSGSIELNLDEIERVLRGAVFLKMKNLIDGCGDFLEKNLNISNCLHWLHLAKELSLAGLEEKYSKFIYKHFEDVTKQSEFLLLNEGELKDLLFNDNSRGYLEEQVFLSLMSWIEYEKINRQHFLFELLSMVRYQFLTPNFIFKNRISVCKTEENSELFNGWLQYHLCPELRTIEQQNFSLTFDPRDEVILNEENSQVVAIRLNYESEAEIRCYNQELGTWYIRKKSRPLLTKQTSNSMIVIDEQLFLVGGTNKNDGKVSSGVECVDLRTFELTELPPMRTARYESQLANLNGHLCVFGGFEKSNSTNFIDSMEIFNFSTGKWMDLQPPHKPEPRNRIFGHKGILYIFDFRYGCLQCYDVFSKQWSSKEQPIDDEVSYFLIVGVGNYLYTICFGSEYYSCRKMCIRIKLECLNVSNDTWLKIVELTDDGAKINMATVLGNKIWFLRTNNCVLQYNLDTNAFTSIDTLNNSNLYYLVPFKL